MTMPPLPPLPVGALTAGEAALLRAWAERHGAACAAAERAEMLRLLGLNEPQWAEFLKQRETVRQWGGA